MANYVVKTDIITDLSKLSDRLDEINLKDIVVWNRVGEEIKTVKELLYNNPNLFAISANQVGFKDRFFCIKFKHGDIRTFINPIILNSKGMHLSREKSESIPNKEFIIPRFDEINVVYTKPTGHVEENQFMGTVAEVFQQMLQNIDGVMISDYGLEVLPEFDQASEEERQELLKMYLSNIKNMSAELDKEIKSDDKLRKFDEAIDFMAGVSSGKIKTQKMTDEEYEQYQKMVEENCKKEFGIKDSDLAQPENKESGESGEVK